MKTKQKTSWLARLLCGIGWHKWEHFCYTGFFFNETVRCKHCGCGETRYLSHTLVHSKEVMDEWEAEIKRKEEKREALGLPR